MEPVKRGVGGVGVCSREGAVFFVPGMTGIAAMIVGGALVGPWLTWVCFAAFMTYVLLTIVALMEQDGTIKTRDIERATIEWFRGPTLPRYSMDDEEARQWARESVGDAEGMCPRPIAEQGVAAFLRGMITAEDLDLMLTPPTPEQIAVAEAEKAAEVRRLAKQKVAREKAAREEAAYEAKRQEQMRLRQEAEAARRAQERIAAGQSYVIDSYAQPHWEEVQIRKPGRAIPSVYRSQQKNAYLAYLDTVKHGQRMEDWAERQHQEFLKKMRRYG